MSTATSSRPSFGHRLWQAFVTLVKIAFVLVILVGLGVAGWFGYQELTRSFSSLSNRAEANRQRIDLLRKDIDTLQIDRTAQGNRVSSLENELAGLDNQVAALTEQLTADLNRQDEMLTELEGQISDLIATTGAITENVAALSAGVIALQGDVNENIVGVDELGGNVDVLSTNVSQLDDDFVALESEVTAVSEAATGQVARMGQALSLFRVWEMVYRARLRLLEQNFGLATADVTIAHALLEALAANGSEEENEALLAVQQRLELAAANLPNDPNTAVRDLESAWEMLDGILSELLGEPEVGLAETAIITPTATITATQPITSTP
jgi:chromosome segregation ATPase